MKLLFLSVSFLLFCVGLGAIVSIVVFCIDVLMWHRSEKRFKVVPSAQELPDEFKESEVKENGRTDSDTSNNDSADAGQSDSSVVFASWLQP